MESSKAAAKESAQQRCQEIQDHLAQALGALGALSSELSDDGESGLYLRQSSGTEQAEDLAFCRGLFDEIIRIAAPADSSSIDPGHVIGALEFMKDNGDIQPEVVVDLQQLLSKHHAIDFSIFSDIVNQVPREKGQVANIYTVEAVHFDFNYEKFTQLHSLHLDRELLLLLRPGTWQDPLFGVRSLSDEEADEICSKFSGRLRALMRDAQARLDPFLAESQMSATPTLVRALEIYRAMPAGGRAARVLTLTLTRMHGMLEKLVGKLSTGDYFGEIALLHRKPRQATVKAVGKLTVLVMDREAFTRLCGNLEAILHRNLGQYSTTELTHDPEADERAALEALVDEDPAMGSPEPSRARTAKARRGSVFAKAVELEANWAPPEYPKAEAEVTRLQYYLSNTALLSHLDSRTQGTVILAVKKQTYQAGTNIIEQGADGDYYYILDSGHANVFITRKGVEEKVFEYSTGGAFGELALIHGEPRLATVRATQECVCWALDRDTFRKIMMSSGKQSMNERTKFLAQVELLKGLAPFERFKIAEVMNTREFVDGDVVVREGDMGDEFFIIQKGTCHVYKLLPDRPTI